MSETPSSPPHARQRSRARRKRRALTGAVLQNPDLLKPDPDQEMREAFGLRDGDEAAPPPFDLPEVVEEDEPPFDPPDVANIFGALDGDDDEGALALTARAPAPEEAPLQLSDPAAPVVRERPAPPLVIHAYWDRPESATMLERFACDPLMARADIAIMRGGVEGASENLRTRASPDLLIVDTTLAPAAMLATLDRLALALEPHAKVLVLGAVNDVGLLRALAQRGVSDYMINPAPDTLVRTVCRLFADTDRSRVVALIGARGGVGVSTLAHNLAWSIAENYDVDALLVDGDIGLGVSGAALEKNAILALSDDQIDSLLEAAPHETDRLQRFAAPPAFGQKMSAASIEQLIARARRQHPFVVIDLPHAWNAWVKQALISADEVIVLATPDLTSLRNTDQIMKALKDARAGKSAAVVALSMVGVPKRPEITVKDFTEALGEAPILSLAYDAALHGFCAREDELLMQTAPRSKAAIDIDGLASAITGREKARARNKRATRDKARAAAAGAAPLELTVRVEGPAPALAVAAAPVDDAVKAEATPRDIPGRYHHLVRARNAKLKVKVPRRTTNVPANPWAVYDGLTPA